MEHKVTFSIPSVRMGIGFGAQPPPSLKLHNYTEWSFYIPKLMDLLQISNKHTM